MTQRSWLLFSSLCAAGATLLFPACAAVAPEAAAEAPAAPSSPSCTVRNESYDPDTCADRCERGDTVSCLWIADRLQAEGYDEGAAAFLQLACADGSAAACARSSDLAARGRGVPADFARAAALHERACATGRQERCELTSRSLRVSASATDPAEGARFDFRALVPLLESGCAAGAGGACFDLALVDAAGLVPPDPERAGALAALACVLGAGPGCSGPDGSPGADASPSTDFERAWLYDQGCLRGNGTACLALGSLLAAGGSVPQDFGRALALYERACVQGEGLACAELDRMRTTPQPLVSLMPMRLPSARLSAASAAAGVLLANVR